MPYSRYILGSLPWYSVLVVSGMVVAILLAEKEEKRRKLPADTALDLALFLLPCGIIGARLYYVFFSWDAFRSHPISILYLWQGGLAIYGGLIGGTIALLMFAHKRHINPLMLCDMVIPGVVLAQAIGRWGNFFNMEAYGAPVNNPLLQFFPLAVLIPSGSKNNWFMATFFYEFAWNLLSFLHLWSNRQKNLPAGSLFFQYMLLYGSGRMVIEGLRLDSLMAIGQGFRVSQMLSAALVFTAQCIVLHRTGLRNLRPWHWMVSCAAGIAGLFASLLLVQQDPFTGFRFLYVLSSFSAVLLLQISITKHIRTTFQIVCLLFSIIIIGFSFYSGNGIIQYLTAAASLALLWISATPLLCNDTKEQPQCQLQS